MGTAAGFGFFTNLTGYATAKLLRIVFFAEKGEKALMRRLKVFLLEQLW